MQLSALMTYLPLPSEIASAGQFAAQVPHMTQSSPITKAIVITSYDFDQTSLPLVWSHCSTKIRKINRHFRNSEKHVD
jgi:hypothetical protein